MANKISVILDMIKGRDDVSGALDKAQSKLSDLQKSATTPISALSSAIGVVGIAATAAVGSVLAIGAALQPAIREAAEAEVALNKLQQALRATGDSSQSTVDSYLAYVDAVEATTLATDDQIISLVALAKNFGVVDNKVKPVVDAALDLQAAFGVDASAAVEALTLALNGNFKAIGGIIPEIKLMNDEQKKSLDVLGLISDRFGQAAEGETKTYTGSLVQLGKTYDNLLESIGKFITENETIKSAISLITLAVGILDDKVKDFKGNARDVEIDVVGVDLAKEGLNKLVFGLKSMQKTIPEIDQAFESVANGSFFGANGVLKQIGPLEKSIADINQSIKESSVEQVEIEKQRLSAIQLLREEEKQRQLEEKELLKLEKQVSSDEDYLFLEEQLGKEAALRSIYEAKKLEDEGKTAEAVKSLRSSRDKALVEQDKKRVASEKDNIFAIQKYEELSNREKLSNLQGTLSYISTLQKSSNRDLFAVGKAAAIATATIDGFQAVQKALASAPPPINFALAALVGTATAANVASIAAQKPPAFQDGGIVPGNSFTGDKVPILANSGELILNKAQQNSLASQLGGSPGLIESILNRPIVIQIDGREIARAVKQQFDQGFGFA